MKLPISIFTPVLIKMNSIILIKFCHIDHAMIDSIILLLLDMLGINRLNFSLLKTVLDFPGGIVDKNAPADPENTGSIPWPGRLDSRGATKPTHLKYWAQDLEPEGRSCWSLCAQSLWVAARDTTAVRSGCPITESSPGSPQLEKALVQQWRPRATENQSIR